ncbi:MAG TPA: VOC family protein [Pseudolabrys sp.]|nr:VOC family protein [Pseudolabrys sp.]
MKGKLRHIALAVTDMEKTAKFYEEAFGLERVRQSKVAIMLSDGVMSLAIIDASNNPNIGGQPAGLHHFGFLVDDMDKSSKEIETIGGQYHGQIKGVGGGPQHERKYRDVNGVPFDVVDDVHAKTVWCIPT